MSTIAEKWVEQGVEQGIQQGIQQGVREGLLAGIEVSLELKFGEAGLQLLPEIYKSLPCQLRSQTIRRRQDGKWKVEDGRRKTQYATRNTQHAVRIGGWIYLMVQ